MPTPALRKLEATSGQPEQHKTLTPRYLSEMITVSHTGRTFIPEADFRPHRLIDSCVYAFANAYAPSTNREPQAKSCQMEDALLSGFVKPVRRKANKVLHVGNEPSFGHQDPARSVFHTAHAGSRVRVRFAGPKQSFILCGDVLRTPDDQNWLTVYMGDLVGFRSQRHSSLGHGLQKGEWACATFKLDSDSLKLSSGGGPDRAV